jgi:hypothetical protein
MTSTKGETEKVSGRTEPTGGGPAHFPHTHTPHSLTHSGNPNRAAHIIFAPFITKFEFFDKLTDMMRRRSVSFARRAGDPIADVPVRAMSDSDLPAAASKAALIRDADIEEELKSLLPPAKSKVNTGHISRASQIARSLRNPGLKADRPYFWSDEDRVLTYELVVAILKCKWERGKNHV